MPEINDITFGYTSGQTILQHFSLSVPAGSRLWISGPSGVGKTTLLRLIMGLEKPDQGSLTGWEKQRFSTVFQEDRLIPHKTVLQNVALFSDEASARAALSELGLADSLNLKPAELSGGMKRRVALARAVSHPFDILILDEPFNGLDDVAKQQCCRIILRVIEGKTLILTSHDAADAKMLGAECVALFHAS